MNKWLKIILNKYLLATAFLLAWILFFDETDFFTQQKHLSDLNNLNQKKAFYKKQIETVKQELTNIKNNDEALEKFARERYLMKKNGEDIYIVEEEKK